MFKQKKLAVINDLAGYGRCSLAVALPVVSAMRVQACPVPTAILSNHMGFPTYYFHDYTDQMMPYLLEWKKLNLTFDGILSGFLGSREQIDIVTHMISEFKTKDTKVIIDPIMGDHGKPYDTYTNEMCQEMKRLVKLGNIVTPNVTEACLLTDTKYKEKGFTRKKLIAMADQILALGPEAVVITGIPSKSYLTNLIVEQGQKPIFQHTKKVGKDRPGTGDLFASIIAAGTVKGMALTEVTRLAARFVKCCIQKSEELGIPVLEGVCFEESLSSLTKA